MACIVMGLTGEARCFFCNHAIAGQVSIGDIVIKDHVMVGFPHKNYKRGMGIRLSESGVKSSSMWA